MGLEPKQTKIIKAATIDNGVQKVRLADTYVSEHNPRAGEEPDQDSIAALAQTIIASGLVDDEGKVGIVAGRRRWHALQIAVKERPDLEVIDVKVTDDLLTARGWAMLENTQREDMDAVDEIRAYAASLTLHTTVFDMYVNAGANAVKILQRLLGDMRIPVSVDGVIGPQTIAATKKGLEAAPRHFVDAYGIARRNYYYDLADRRANSRKYARRRDGGKGGWITRAEEFIGARYHFTDKQHRERTAKWG